MLNFSLMPELLYEGKPALAPQKADLQRLYDFIIRARATTVLEFGCGYSTWAISEALRVNRDWFDFFNPKPEVRNPALFEHFAIDANANWIAECEIKIKSGKFYYSECETKIYGFQMCHVYLNPLKHAPDFIYLDGPALEQVPFWQYRTPISADILLIEAYLIPGTQILIDGRTNNARFLQNNLKRNWKFHWNSEEDYTWALLDEPRLGKINAVGRDLLDWIEKQNSKN